MGNSFLDTFEASAYPLKGKNITVGFDGFVDSIVRVIRDKSDSGTGYFETIKEFGEYTSGKTGKSFSLEMEEQTVKLGGNMPILANALSNFGANISCVGSLGYPEIHPVFQSLARKAKVYSYSEPGASTALEFNDGKILLAQMTSLNKADWRIVLDIVGDKILKEVFTSCDLIGMVNWSELDHGTAIWRGVLDLVMSTDLTSDRTAIGFFDLSDCSRRSDVQIKEILDIIKQFSRYWKTVLSLNLNEASIIYRIIANKEIGMAHLEGSTKELRDKLGVHAVVIHHSKGADACDELGSVHQPSIHLASPKISTGAGDNFNAGFCTGILMNMSLADCLTLGHRVAWHYMQEGASPTVSDMIDRSLH